MFILSMTKKHGFTYRNHKKANAIQQGQEKKFFVQINGNYILKIAVNKTVFP